MSKQELKLPQGWTMALLPDVVKNEPFAIKRGPFGSNLKKEFFVESGYKVYEQQHAINNDFTLGTYYVNEKKFQQLKSFEVKQDDIIISCSGTIGKIAIAPKNIKKGIINQALLKLSIDESIMPREFFKYLFKFWMEKSQIESHGSGMGNLSSVKVLKKIPILLPPLNEQKRIICKIEDLFSQIHLCEQSLEHTNLQLKQYRMSLLKSTFKQISTQCKPFKLNELCTKITDGTHFTPKYEQSGIPFISVKDIRNGKISFEKCKFISQKTHNELIKRCNPEFNDLLITKSGTIGRMAIVKTKKDFSLFVSVALIKPNKNINRKYLNYILENFINHTTISQEIKGGVIKNFHLEDLREVKIMLPNSQEEQKLIVSQIEQSFSLIENTSQMIHFTLQKLKIMKISILKRAFEGKLVPQNPNAEKAQILLDKINIIKQTQPTKQRRMKNVK